MDKTEKDDKQNIFDSIKWGLPMEAINELGKRLKNFWKRFNFFLRPGHVIIASMVITI